MTEREKDEGCPWCGGEAWLPSDADVNSPGLVSMLQCRACGRNWPLPALRAPASEGEAVAWMQKRWWVYAEGDMLHGTCDAKRAEMWRAKDPTWIHEVSLNPATHPAPATVTEFGGYSRAEVEGACAVADEQLNFPTGRIGRFPAATLQTSTVAALVSAARAALGGAR